MIKYKFTVELRRFINKSAGKLRAFRAAAVGLLTVLTLSCTKDDTPAPCLNGPCDAQMIFPVQPDQNGYYHIKLDWSREYLPYFIIDVEASLIDPWYHYNGVSVVEAAFDSNTTWVIGEDLVFTDPTYSPFQGNYSSSGTPLPTGYTNLVLSQFKGTKVNVVQSTSIRFKEDGNKLTSKRVVGPFPPTMIQDTITLYMEVFWDAGNKSVLRSDFLEKFIVE